MRELTNVAEVCEATFTFERDTEEFVNDYLSKEEKNNQLLDTILSFQKRLENINSKYMSIFISFESLFNSPIERLNDNDFTLINDLIKTIKKTNNDMLETYLRFLKNKTISQGCKSPLTDLKVNIYSMKETINDLEEVFIHKKYTTPEFKAVLSNF
jgi:hypothetical protein